MEDNCFSIASPTFAFLDLGPISTWGTMEQHGRNSRSEGPELQPGGNLHQWNPWPTGDSHLLWTVSPLKDTSSWGKRRFGSDLFSLMWICVFICHVQSHVVPIASFPPNVKRSIFNLSIREIFRLGPPCLCIRKSSIHKAGNHDGSHISRTSISEHRLCHTDAPNWQVRGLSNFKQVYTSSDCMGKTRQAMIAATYLHVAIYCSGLVSSWIIQWYRTWLPMLRIKLQCLKRPPARTCFAEANMAFRIS